MASRRKARKEELEAAAASFLAEAESPQAPDRLRDYGLQRIMARSKADEVGKMPAATRRAYRNPATLRHVVVIALAVLLVMFLSTTGVYALSLDAQPGSTLYGSKIFFERARVALSTSSTGDIRLEMGFSERRMQELENMLASGDQEGAERWSREYNRNIEGAGALFDTLPVQETEELSSQFQEMLDRQAQMMQGMRHGLPSGLSKPVDDAYQVCDMERSRMRMRCGQQDGGEQAPGPGGQQGQEECPRMEDSPSGGETSPGGDTAPSSGNSGSGESTSPAGTPQEGTTDGTTDTAPQTQTPPGPSQPEYPQTGTESQMMGETGYQGGNTGKGHMP